MTQYPVTNARFAIKIAFALRRAYRENKTILYESRGTEMRYAAPAVGNDRVQPHSYGQMIVVDKKTGFREVTQIRNPFSFLANVVSSTETISQIIKRFTDQQS